MELTAQERRQRLFNPPNAVEDKPIDLRPYWKRMMDQPVAQVKPVKVERPLPPIEFGCFCPACLEVRPAHRLEPKIGEIIRLVARTSMLSVVDITSQRRTAKVALQRQIAMYLATKLTRRSLPEIGRVFRRDHTTCLHGRNKIAALRLVDPALNEILDWYEAELGKT